MEPTEAINKLIRGIIRIPLGEWIPKGNLTRTSSWLQGAIGLFLLAGVIWAGIKTGQWDLDLDAILGVLLLGNAGQGAGLARKIEPPTPG